MPTGLSGSEGRRVVELHDLEIIKAAWGTAASGVDRDGDGIVGATDLLSALAE